MSGDIDSVGLLAYLRGCRDSGGQCVAAVQHAYLLPEHSKNVFLHQLL